MHRVLNIIKTQSSPDVKIFLIGNKVDLADKRKVPQELAEQFVKDNHLNYFIEISAKAGFNASTVFIEAAKILYLEHLRYKDKSSRPGSIASGKPRNVLMPTPKKGEEEKVEEKKGCAC